MRVQSGCLITCGYIVVNLALNSDDSDDVDSPTKLDSEKQNGVLFFQSVILSFKIVAKYKAMGKLV